MLTDEMIFEEAKLADEEMMNNVKSLFIINESSNFSYVSEAGAFKNKLKSVIKTTKSIIKAMSTCSDMISRFIKAVGMKISKYAKSKNTKVKYEGKNPLKIKSSLLKVLEESGKALIKVMNEPSNFKKWGLFALLVVPSPGLEVVFISASTLLDILLDYERRMQGKEYSAIKRFDEWCEKEIKTADAVDEYEMDKILSKMATCVHAINAEAQRVYAMIDNILIQAAAKTGNAIDKATGENNNPNNIVKRGISKHSRVLNDMADGTKQNVENATKVTNKYRNMMKNNFSESVEEVQDILSDFNLL